MQIASKESALHLHRDWPDTITSPQVSHKQKCNCAALPPLLLSATSVRSPVHLLLYQCHYPRRRNFLARTPFIVEKTPLIDKMHFPAGNFVNPALVCNNCQTNRSPASAAAAGSKSKTTDAMAEVCHGWPSPTPWKQILELHQKLLIALVLHGVNHAAWLTFLSVLWRHWPPLRHFSPTKLPTGDR